MKEDVSHPPPFPATFSFRERDREVCQGKNETAPPDSFPPDCRFARAFYPHGHSAPCLAGHARSGNQFTVKRGRHEATRTGHRLRGVAEKTRITRGRARVAGGNNTSVGRRISFLLSLSRNFSAFLLRPVAD